MNKYSLINKANKNAFISKYYSERVFDDIISLIKDRILEDKYFLADYLGEFVVERRRMETREDYKLNALILFPPKDKIVFNFKGDNYDIKNEFQGFEIVRLISKNLSISEDKIYEFYISLFKEISNALLKSKNINIPEFGKFRFKKGKVKYSPVRKFAKEVNHNFCDLKPSIVKYFEKQENEIQPESAEIQAPIEEAEKTFPSQKQKENISVSKEVEVKSETKEKVEKTAPEAKSEEKIIDIFETTPVIESPLAEITPFEERHIEEFIPPEPILMEPEEIIPEFVPDISNEPIVPEVSNEPIVPEVSNEPIVPEVSEEPQIISEPILPPEVVYIEPEEKVEVPTEQPSEIIKENISEVREEIISPPKKMEESLEDELSEEEKRFEDDFRKSEQRFEEEREQFEKYLAGKEAVPPKIHFESYIKPQEVNTPEKKEEIPISSFSLEDETEKEKKKIEDDYNEIRNKFFEERKKMEEYFDELKKKDLPFSDESSYSDSMKPVSPSVNIPKEREVPPSVSIKDNTDVWDDDMDILPKKNEDSLKNKYNPFEDDDDFPSSMDDIFTKK